MIKKLRVLGIAAGQGALLYPFMNRENARVLGNIEPRAVFHTDNEEQWKLNFGEIPFEKQGLPENLKPNVIVGSPDCGASSVMRLSKVKVLGNPEENKSLGLVIEGILFYKPKVFLIENLPRLLNLMPKNFFESTFSDYDLIFHQHSVSMFGNSQVSRKRLVIIGIKKGSSRAFKNLLTSVFQLKPIKCTRQLLKPLKTGYENGNCIPPLNKTLAMYDYRKLPEKKNLTVKEIHRLWTTDFKDEKKWPIKTKKMSTLPGVYRLENDKPPLTVRPSDRQFRPDGWPLGIQDFRRIMGFPKSFRVYFDESQRVYWLNKARNTLAKGSVYEVGLWFYIQLSKALEEN